MGVKHKTKNSRELFGASVVGRPSKVRPENYEDRWFFRKFN